MTHERHVNKVSPKAEAALRAAAKLLLSGKAGCTDGALTKNNLHREAGVSRATMNRAADVLADWDRDVTASADRPQNDTPQVALLEQFSADAAALKDEIRRLRHQLDGSATVIAALHLENRDLRRLASGVGAPRNSRSRAAQTAAATGTAHSMTTGGTVRLTGRRPPLPDDSAPKPRGPVGDGNREQARSRLLGLDARGTPR